jgi:hypothetical protein
MADNTIPTCPHCGAECKKWKVPPDATWDTEFMWVCFNDDCSYYVRGWEWMIEKYQHRSSYRYRKNPVNGEEGPIPVWSPTALKSQIVED